ncbi:NapH phosphatase [Micromonospora sp. ATCC 39149]|nr:NapH phosphatase [Micromonospora sp. ATCC 39149]
MAREACALAYAEVVGDGDAPVDEYCRHPGRYLPEVLRLMNLPAAMADPFVRESNRLSHLVVPVDGAAGLLGALRRRGIGLAVATGRSGARARDLLGRLDMLPLLDHVVGSDEVARPKPAPDIVRRALELLGVAPADAGPGQRARLRAGLPARRGLPLRRRPAHRGARPVRPGGPVHRAGAVLPAALPRRGLAAARPDAGRAGSHGRLLTARSHRGHPRRRLGRRQPGVAAAARPGGDRRRRQRPGHPLLPLGVRGGPCSGAARRAYRPARGLLRVFVDCDPDYFRGGRGRHRPPGAFSLRPFRCRGTRCRPVGDSLRGDRCPWRSDERRRSCDERFRSRPNCPDDGSHRQR